MALLQKALADGDATYDQVQGDSDLDALRARPDFAALLAAGRLERRYAAVWHPSNQATSTEVHGLDPEQHRARCRALVSQGYRPVSVAVAAFGADGGPTVAASVWQRPVVPDAEKEQLAKRQANAAVALLRLGQGQHVWPLLQHRTDVPSDPRRRSYLIHRLSPLGADLRALVQQFDTEANLSVQRALLLCLGEFTPEQWPPAQRQPLVQRLLRLYREQADPGLRGAAEWFLRRQGQGAQLQEIDRVLAQQRAQKEQQIRRELAGGSKAPRWYVNGQGQTMVVLPGPVEFLMGSPGTEAEREGGAEGRVEALHRRQIGQAFAVAAKEVTVAQFQAFRRNHQYNRQYAPTPDCPVNVVTWYDAAAYCNWLSAQEGIPPEEWCYLQKEKPEALPIFAVSALGVLGTPGGGPWLAAALAPARVEGDYAAGMRPAPDYLRRLGYRLPNEAEWEYACRAGAVTARPYGETDTLLEQYAWYAQNRQSKGMHPGAERKPNDLGFFDLLGNGMDWCQEHIDYFPPQRGGRVIKDKEYITYLKDNQYRVLRGGSLVNHPVDVRSAYRYRLTPANRSDTVGFRPARTFR
jgi:formylglycine-generating enzyme required for sulfatase activity